MPGHAICSREAVVTLRGDSEMWRSALIGTVVLPSVLVLGGCSGVGKFFHDTVTLPGMNPNLPSGTEREPGTFRRPRHRRGAAAAGTRQCLAGSAAAVADAQRRLQGAGQRAGRRLPAAVRRSAAAPAVVLRCATATAWGSARTMPSSTARPPIRSAGPAPRGRTAGLATAPGAQAWGAQAWGAQAWEAPAWESPAGGDGFGGTGGSLAEPCRRHAAAFQAN